MGMKKLGEGQYTLYLEECPNCGKNRVLNEDKFYGLSAMSAGGILTGILFGAPIMGALGALGLVKLAIAGSISYQAAVKLIQANYKLLEKLNSKALYTCPNCKCTKII
jgi:predicted RNA-binding Zn-ribbon protein involved in translation (DUF1610 family)